MSAEHGRGDADAYAEVQAAEQAQRESAERERKQREAVIETAERIVIAGVAGGRVVGEHAIDRAFQIAADFHDAAREYREGGAR